MNTKEINKFIASYKFFLLDSWYSSNQKTVIISKDIQFQTKTAANHLHTRTSMKCMTYFQSLFSMEFRSYPKNRYVCALW